MNLRRSRLLLYGLLLGVLAAASIPASSYLPGFTRPAGGGEPQVDRWDFSAFAVTWRLNPATGSNVSGNRSVAQVMESSFNRWLAAPNAQLAVSRGANTGSTSPGFDGMNLVCFVCQADFTEEEHTLAVTLTTISDRAGQNDRRGGTSNFVGQILDSDILFNPNRNFSTGEGGSGQDVETVAGHEVGHFFGLDHSGVVRAIMFPFAPPFLRSLGYDDVAGIASLYPKATPDVPVGVITGTVRLNGTAVFGAHVFAESVSDRHPFGGSIRKTPIGMMTRPDGTYRIEHVPVDSYIVTAEPFDGPASNENIPQYAPAFNRGSVQTGFTTRWH
jgi:hypothetical protein